MNAGKWKKLLVTAVLLFITIMLLALPGGTPPAFAAQESIGYLREIRIFDNNDAGLANPIGLTFSPEAGLFFVLESPIDRQTNIAAMTPYSRIVSSMRMDTALTDGMNIAFDDRTNQLLFFNPISQKLVKTAVNTERVYSRPAITSLSANELNLKDPRGMVVVPSKEQLIFLDSSAQQLVYVEVKEGEQSDDAGMALSEIARINLEHTGVTDAQGLTLNHTNDHLYFLSPSQLKAYEITKTGQIVNVFDLASFNLTLPQSVVVAPSGDRTDDPTIMSLYIVDTAKVNDEAGQTSIGQIVELSMAEPGQKSLMVPTDLVTLVNTTDTSLFGPPNSLNPSPDPAGVTYLDSSNTLLISDSEVNEMSIYGQPEGSNMFQTALDGTLLSAFTTLPHSDEPTDVAYNPNNEHIFFTDDTGDRGIYEMDPGPDGLYATADDIVTFVDTEAFGASDAEGVSYNTWNGNLFMTDGLNQEVYEINPGPNGIFDGVAPAGDDTVTNFDVAQHNIQDPEGSAFNWDNGHLYVLGKNELIGEFTTDGTLIRYLDISSIEPTREAGIVYAPASTNPNADHIYIVARGVDNGSDPNENDGKMYEVSFPDNEAPTVDAGPDQTVTMVPGVTLDGTVSDDGKPNPPGTVTTAWSKVSGPGTVTFADDTAVDTTATFSVVGTYELRLTADDNEKTSSDDVIITVIPDGPNQAPTANAGPDQTITFPSQATLDGTISDDGLPFPPGVVTPTWSVVSAPATGTVTFADASAEDTTATFSIDGVYVLRLTADDSELTTSDDITITIDPPPPNTAPTVNAGADQLITFPNNAILDGTANDDGLPVPPGMVTTTWSMVSGPGVVTFGDASAVATTASFNSSGVYTLRLTADDGELTTTDDVVITSNAVPTVVAGPDQTVSISDGAVLDGTVTDDGLPNPPGLITTAWSMVSGPGGGIVDFGDAAAVDTTATFSERGTYVLRLTADDSTGPVSDDITVTVTGPDGEVAFEVRINSSTDDAEERQSGNITLANRDLEMVFDKNGDQTVGLRFNGVDIPQGANITTAHVQFTVDETPSGPTTLTIEGEDTVNAATYTNTDFNISSRPRTAASVPWLPPPWPTVGAAGPDQQTADISAIIQEIVDQPGWVSGNALAIIIGGDGERVAESYNGSSADAPLLRVTYTLNLPPNVDAGADQSVTLPASAMLDGTVTDDGQPNPPGVVTTAWSKVSGPGTVTFANATAVDTTASFSVDGTYVLRLTADDSHLSASDDVTVTVTAPNQAPTVMAGSDQTITLPAGASLDGTVTDDGLPTPVVTTTWSVVSGPGSVTFADANAVDTTASFSLDGTYVLRLTADDGEFTASDDITVTVNPIPNQAPTVEAGTNQTTSLPSASVNLDGTVTDDGLPNPPATVTTTWSVVNGPDVVTFGDAAVVDTTASFVTDGVYVLRLTADDSELTASDEVTITVTPENQPPTVNAGLDQTITLPDSALLDGTVTDDGWPSGTLTTTWSVVSGTGSVAFTDAAAVDTTASFSEAGIYVLRLTADDSDLTASDDLTITVNPAPNQAPIVDAGADQIVNLPNLANLDGTVSDDNLPNPPAAITTTWSVVSGTGSVTFADAANVNTTANFSIAGTYVLRLTADDSELTASDEVTIIVTPPNQPPTVDAGLNQTIALTDTAALDGTVADDGLPTPTVTTTWSMVTGTGNVTFGDATAVDTTATFSDVGVYVLRLTADDSLLMVSDEVTVTVDPPTNQPPVVDAGPDAAVNLPNIHQLQGSVSDDGWPNPPATITTTWSVFSGPGNVTFSDPTILDPTASFSIEGVYVLRLTADDSDLTATDDVTITVSAIVNQPPVVDAGPDQTINSANDATLDGTVTDDGLPTPVVTTTWSVVTGTGSVTFVDAMAVDTMASFSQVGTYVLRLTADDNELITSDEITITVTGTSGEMVIDVQVSSSSDDVEESSSGGVDLNSSDLEIVFYKVGNQTIGLRFNGIGIPQGAIITSAYVQFQVDETPSDPAALTIQGELVDNALPFVNVSGNVSTRPKTVETVAWSPPAWPTVGEAGPDQRTSDIAAIIQEIVGQTGWASGNSLALIITGTGKRVAESFDGDQAGAPILHIEYLISGQQPPNVAAGLDQSIIIGAGAALDGTVSDDGLPNPPGTLTTTWSVISGPGTVTFTNAMAVDTTATFSAIGTYTLRLTADDSELTASDEVEITVMSNQNAPTVDAGPDQAISILDPAILDGTVSDDGLPNPPGTLTTTWSVISGPGTVTFTNAMAVDTMASFSQVGTYVLRLTADDNELITSDEITITVTGTSGEMVIDVQVSSSSDDVEESSSGGVDLNSSDLEIVFYKVGNQTIGLRFNGIGIPQGAIITSAYVQFQVDETPSDPAALTIQGELVDNALPFVNVSGNVSTRPKTVETVAWSPPAWPTVGEAGPDQRTSDIAAIIQEIVGQTGWASGNSLALIITGTGKRVAESFDGDQAGAPILHIEYTSGGSLTAPASSDQVSNGATGDVVRTAAADGDGLVFDFSVSQQKIATLNKRVMVRTV